MQRTIVTVLGKAGSGKTHLTRNVLLPAFQKATGRTVFVLDTMDEFHDGLLFPDMVTMYQHITQGRPNVSGVYVLKAETDNDCQAFVRIFGIVKAPCLIVLDEASKLCNPAYLEPGLSDVIQYGRHWGCDLIMTARRATELNRNTTAQSDAIISFRQTEPLDIRTLSRSFSEARHLNQLRGHEYVVLGSLPDDIEARLKPVPIAELKRRRRPVDTP